MVQVRPVLISSLSEMSASIILGRFRAKACPGLDAGRTAVRVKKTRQNKRPGLDIAVLNHASTAQRLPDHSRQIGFAIRLGEQQHAGVEAAVMHDGILGIS